MIVDDIIERMNAVIHTLASPLTTQEAAEGWTSETKSKAAAMFVELRATIVSSQPVPALSLSRALDSWGIVDGPLLEESALISNQLRTYSQEHP